MENYSDKIKKYLNSEEELKWVSTPLKNFKFDTTNYYTIVLGLVLVVFGFRYFYFNSNFTAFNIASFILLSTMGLYMIIGRNFVDAYIRSKSIYAVTDKRILFIRDIFGVRVKQYELQQLPIMYVDKAKTNPGILYFGNDRNKHKFSYLYGQRYTLDNKIIPAFEYIDNTKEVYKLILKLQRELQSPTD